MSRLRRLAWAAVIVVVVLLGAAGGGGYLLFGTPSDDPLRPVDAIVVLGGEHDGREQYGIQLAEAGYARTVVLSNPYGRDDFVMRDLCDRKVGEVSVICEEPVPSTTRGEAMIAQRPTPRDLLDPVRWTSHSTLLTSGVASTG